MVEQVDNVQTDIDSLKDLLLSYHVDTNTLSGVSSFLHPSPCYLLFVIVMAALVLKFSGLNICYAFPSSKRLMRVFHYLTHIGTFQCYTNSRSSSIMYELKIKCYRGNLNSLMSFYG